MNIHEKEQFKIIIKEDGKIINEKPIFDPLHNTTLEVPKGFKSAWHVLRKGLKFSVMVSSTREADRVIFTGDYSPIEDKPTELYGDKAND